MQLSATAYGGLSEFHGDKQRSAGLASARWGDTLASEFGIGGLSPATYNELFAGMRLHLSPRTDKYSRSVRGNCSPQVRDPVTSSSLSESWAVPSYRRRSTAPSALYSVSTSDVLVSTCGFVDEQDLETMLHVVHLLFTVPIEVNKDRLKTIIKVTDINTELLQ